MSHSAKQEVGEDVAEMNAAAESFRTSPQQRRAWALYAGGDGRGAPYAVHAEIAVRGPLESGRLLRALSALSEGNEIFRASLGRAPGLTMPVMHIHPPKEGAASLTDLSSLSAEQSRLALDRCFATRLDTGGGLGADPSAPLFAAQVFRFAPEDHRLVVSLASAAGDAGALQDLVEQLAETLVAADGAAPERLQYPDLAEWQLQLLEGENGEDGRAFWERQRQDSASQPLLLESASDEPFEPREERFVIPESVLRAVGDLATAAETDVEAIWLAAWGWQLARLADRQGGTLGVLADGRRMEELRSVQGPMARHLPLSFEAEGADTLITLARRLAESWDELLAWQEVFDPSIQDPPRHLVEIRSRIPAVSAGSWEVEVVALRTLTERFTTRLVVESDGENPSLLLGVDARRLRSDDSDGFARGLWSLLETAAGNPEAALGSLPLHSREDAERLLEELRPTPPADPQDVITAFAAHAAAKPDAFALLTGGGSTSGGSRTYGELASEAEALARRLEAAGVGPEVVVGIHLPRDHRLIVSVLAVMAAGGAYLALDPTYPWRRLAGAAEDAGAQVLITDPALAGELDSGLDSELAREFSGTTLELPLAAAEAGESLELRVRPVAPRNSAYVLFTSGSTGRPKGVVIDRASLAASTAARPVHYREPVGVFLLISSLSFDSSVAGLFWTLSTGGTLALPPDGFQHDVPRLLEDAGRWGVTHLLALPALWRLLLEQEAATAGLAALRCAIVAGEACPASLVSLHHERLPGAELHNEYGPTEGTVWATVADLSAATELAIDPPIGSAAGQARIYLVAGMPATRPVPLGMAGELLVGGSSVARGYVGRAAETAARFLPDPWAEIPGARLYRTGDRAWLRRDGAAMFLGRGDRQIKVRGHRIEPAEVESVLGGHPALREVVVVVKQKADEAPRLLAWVEAEQEIEAEAILDWLRERLPEPQVPSQLVAVDALPRLPNGKLDRAALAEAEPASTRAPYVEPRNPTERALAEVWAEVLQQSRVGIDDNFFQLGGDSIQSVRVRALAASRGVEISVQDLFRHRTVRALAELAGEAEEAPNGLEKVPFEGLSDADRERLPEDAEDAFPLLALQAGMLFESERDPDSGHYVDVVSFDLKAPFDEQALRRALAAMAQAHPVLRTSFHLRGFDQPLQVVHRDVEVPLEVVDLAAGTVPSGVPSVVPSAEEIVAQERSRPFDPAVAPLLRLRVHRLDGERFRLTLCDHHAILDGWSSASFLTALMGLYRDLVASSSAALPEAPEVGLREAVEGERRALEDPATADFWEQWLAGAPRTVLPPRIGAPRATEGKQSLEVEIPSPVAAGLRKLAETMGLPLRSLLLAAHLRCLAEVAGEPEVVSGLVTHGRPETEGGEKALGLFLNTLPFRLRLEAGSWRELVEQVHGAEGEMIPHRRYPLAEMVRRGGGALFDSVFNYVHFHVQRQVGELSGFEVLSTTALETTELPLVAHFQSAIDGPGITGELMLDGDRLGRDQMAALSTLYPQVLAQMAAEPEARHDHFAPQSSAPLPSTPLPSTPLPSTPLPSTPLSSPSWDEVTVEEGPTPAPGTPLTERLGELARQPGTAILGELGELSWGELATRALGIGERLHALGIGAEEPLPLLLRRGLDETVAFLGALAGPGVCLPLDPAEPSQRLTQRLAGTGARRALVSAPFAELAWGLGLEPVLVEELTVEGLVAEELADSPASGEGVEGSSFSQHPQQLGYLISTSGSTGEPRRVAVTSGHATGHGETMARWLDLGSEDRLLQFAGWTFDLALEDFYTTLAAGSSLVMRGGELWDPASLEEAVEANGVTVVSLPTAVAHAWLRGRGDRPAPPALRAVLVGGEALDPEITSGWRQGPLAKVDLINHYGPAEVTVAATAWRLPAEGWKESGPVPIGAALEGREARVVGPFGHPALPGLAGELLLGGRLGRGYGDAAATAERFLPDGLTGSHGARLYRSGDRVTELSSGELVFLGRSDLQLKVRGVRVEPQEIEKALAEHPGVRQAVVMPVQEAGEMRLCAWVEVDTLEPESAGSDSAGSGSLGVGAVELAAHLRSRLPPAMIPAAWAVVEALPRTAGGKIDRRTLPTAVPIVAEDRTPPGSEGERQVAQVWARLLDLEDLAVEDDFFLLGGHSLLAARAVAELRESSGVALSLAEMLAARTVQGVGRLVDQRRSGETESQESGDEVWEEIEI
ncbi:MAG: amino acid adenylation domain-containing protein [Acidobacteriota bacterium]